MNNTSIIVLSTTMRCNRKCPFCRQEGIRQKYGLRAGDMTIETVKKILSQYPEDSSITLTGGEPFLNYPVIDYLISIDRPFCVHTNGDHLFPEGTKLKPHHTVRISINDIEFPPVYHQLIRDMPEASIRTNTYFDDPVKTFQIIEKLAQDDIYDYRVLIDLYTEESKELEEKILQYVKLAGKLPLPGRNRAYQSYHQQALSTNPVFKYAPDGSLIPGIYLPEVPKEHWDEEMGPWMQEDEETFLYGKEKYHLGIKAFKAPCAYYACFMYEKLKEEKEARLAAFNQIFKY